MKTYKDMINDILKSENASDAEILLAIMIAKKEEIPFIEALNRVLGV